MHRQSLKRMFGVFILLLFAALVFGPALLRAQEQEKPPAAPPARPGAPASMPGAAPVAPPAAPSAAKPFSVTKHTITLDGKVIPYTATVGELTVLKSDEKPGAAMFFAAYTRDDAKDKATRPVTFLFNGGPGSSTLWLHLGGLGPKRVVMDDNGHPSKAPYGLTDSDCSLLDVTDMVFIDAVSTGYSRPLPGEKGEQFHGILEDANAFAEFIRVYLGRFDRWSSPKFLLGESYGTTRAAALSGVLQGNTYGIYLNGIVLLSTVLDFSTLSFNNDLTYEVYLPHYAATAWYHKTLPAENEAKPLPQLVQEAREFAFSDYAQILLQGNLADPKKYDEVARRLSGFIGLPVDYLKQTNLKVNHQAFMTELLKSRHLMVGRIDSRITGPAPEAGNGFFMFGSDPSTAMMTGAFATMLNNYVSGELNYKKEIPYAVYGNVYPWNYSMRPSFMGISLPGGGGGEDSVNVATTLRDSMADNPDLKVFCCNGYFDGATPFLGTEYTFAHIGMNGEFKDRVKMGYYEAGHMMYIHKPSLKKLKADLAAFYASACGK